MYKKINKLPQEPGVYFFMDRKGEILYIGKATDLRSRVRSYFRGYNPNQPINANQRIANVEGRSEWIGRMIMQVADIKFQQTDSVLEALIFESNLIKKHQPKYNTMEKDDKSFAYFVVTKEEYPRIMIFRKTDIDFAQRIMHNVERKIKNAKTQNAPRSTLHVSRIYGPYLSKYQMQVALKIIRRIFPFHSLDQKTEKGCLDFQIGMCPGPYDGAISKEDYRKNIRNIRMILEGKKKSLVKKLEKEMKEAAKKNEFEKAADLRNKIFALQHIRDVALMTRDFNSESNVKTSKRQNVLRIEAYDISNISGMSAVGSMVVFVGSELDKSQYRKFKIKTAEGSDDVGMMKEVLARRFRNDWQMPDLILLDGGIGHVNMGAKLLKELGLAVPIIGVAKGPTRKNLKLQIPNSKQYPNSKITNEIRNILNDRNLIKSVMDEAHRFAIAYHRKVRSSNALK